MEKVVSPPLCVSLEDFLVLALETAVVMTFDVFVDAGLALEQIVRASFLVLEPHGVPAAGLTELLDEGVTDLGLPCVVGAALFFHLPVVVVTHQGEVLIRGDARCRVLRART